MKILPLDIKQQKFNKSMRGFDTDEVKTFLEVLAQSFEELIRENNSLKDELRRHINQVNDYRDKESTLKETMLTAQKISEDMKTQAKKEADLIVREAEMKSERMLGETHEKMLKIVDRIQEIKLDRSRFVASLKSIIQQHLKLIETAEQEERTLDRVENNLAYLEPKSKTGQ